MPEGQADKFVQTGNQWLHLNGYFYLLSDLMALAAMAVHCS